MAVTATWYGPGVGHLADADIDWVADTIHVSLHTASYTPDEDTHDFGNDLTNEVANGNGYTTGGVALANKTLTVDSASNEMRLDADNVEWASASFTCRYAVIRKVRGGAESANELLGYVDFGGDETVSSGTFRIEWDETGVLKVTY